MKQLTRILFLLFAACIASCSKQDSQAVTKTLYTCGMHPQVIQDHPGNCPICEMKLTPIRNAAVAKPAAETATPASGERKIKYYKSTMMPGEISQSPGKDSMGMDMVPVYEEAGGAATPGATESSVISIDPVTIQNMGIRTGEVTRGPLRRSIQTVGIVDYNETALTDVTVRFKGWLEKLYVDSTGQEVKKGDPLFEIYSPDLVSAQNEYLIAVGGGASSANLKASAVRRLRNFDISDDQIAELERTREIKKTLRVNAPRTGIVVEKMAVEGQMVDAGMKLYRLADLSLVWVQSQVYEQDLGMVKLGQEAEVRLTYLPDRLFRGRVTYVYPTVDEKTRTARVRMEFHNPGLFLKPGMFAKVELKSELDQSALLVPDSAVLRSGEKNTVFVALDGGKFEPRTLVLGPRGEGNYYQVLSGLKEGERVVMSGQFMLDSESQLKEAIQKMIEPGKAQGGGEPSATPEPGVDEHAAHGAVTPSSWQPGPETEPRHYVCPMAEHSSIQYDHSGKCPICGMTMIPAEPLAPRASPAAPTTKMER
ncbi:MAG: efflux RND transporter periplasmic adaptor subunit [Verrucomicrobiota bacterium]